MAHRVGNSVEQPDATASLDGQPDPSRAAIDLLRPGSRLGRYTVLERLGSGGMGVVFAAYDGQLDRQVALKILRAERTEASRESDALLKREAQALARLSHPNVVTVHDVGELGGLVFMTMEFLRGDTLKAWLGRRQRSWREVVGIFLQAGEGLAAAHAAGLVHRDFKPGNVLVGDDGRVRVMDFGLARLAPVAHADPAPGDPVEPAEGAPGSRPPDRGLLSSPFTRTGALVGTPGYLAPEQLRGGPADERSDQFAFCVALYEALWGVHPFADDTPADRRAAALSRRRPERLPAAAVPGWLRRLVVRGLEADPAARHPSMKALLAALGRDPDAVRRRRLTAVVVVVLAAGAASGWWATERRRSALCNGGARLVPVWNPERRAAVAAAFESSGKPYAADSWRGVEKRLDGFASAWTQMYGDACAATHFRGEQSAELLDLRMACLDRRLRAFDALAERFARADAATVEKAVVATDSLGGLDACADTETLTARVKLPADPTVRAEVDRVEGELARVDALGKTGAFEDALAIADGAVASARELAYPPLEAEALLVRGQIHDGSGQYELARQDRYDAVLAAQRGGDDAQVVEAGLWLARTVGYRLSKPEEARPWEALAVATLARLGGDRFRLEALAASSRMMLAAQGGTYEEALEAARRALSFMDRAGLSESGDAAELHNNLGVTLTNLGRYDEAVEAYERSSELYRAMVGPEHPLVADVIFNESSLAWSRGDLERALEYGLKALAIRERSLAADHPSLALSYNSVAQPLQNLGRYDEARAYQLKAMAIHEKTLGPDHVYVAASLNNLAFNEREQGHFKAAAEHYRRALGIFEASLGAEHPYVAFALTGLGITRLRMGEPYEAVAPLTRALEIRRGAATAPKDLASTAFYLAQALWPSGRDRPRARRLAEEALALFDEAGEGFDDERGAVASWLAENRP